MSWRQEAQIKSGAIEGNLIYVLPASCYSQSCDEYSLCNFLHSLHILRKEICMNNQVHLNMLLDGVDHLFQATKITTHKSARVFCCARAVG